MPRAADQPTSPESPDPKEEAGSSAVEHSGASAEDASPPAGAGPGANDADDANADIAGLSYEDARAELVDIVGRLEAGRAGLEESMTLWERGEALAAHCGTWLDRAEARLGARTDTTG